MSTYRKRPVVIDAIRFSGSAASCDEVTAFLEAGYGNHRWKKTNAAAGGYIITLEGEMEFRVGDWIIRSVEGEFYPCRASVFDATYEPA